VTSAAAAVSNFASGFGQSTAATGTGIFMCGNSGIPYGSVIIQIPESDVSKYQNTIKIDGTSLTDPHTVGFWTKCGPTGALDGFFQSPLPLEFQLAPGSIAYVAVDNDVQGGFAYGPGTSLPRTPYGSVAGIWVEFDFANSQNNLWSGYDASCIISQNAAMTSGLVGVSVCLQDGTQCSNIGSACNIIENAYDSALAAAGGIGANIVPGPVQMVAKLGWS
jgi:hypothetical protein